MSSVLDTAVAAPSRVRADTQPRPANRGDEERAALRAGLMAPQAQIDPKYFYDDQGCVLFSAICELEEYYPTRLERHIFETYREDIESQLPRGMQWIDLGCGDCHKSKRWLATLPARRFVGVDIAEDWLRQSVEGVRSRYPALECVALPADFTRELALQQQLGDIEEMPPVFFYPGSSIGNFTPQRAAAFLASIRRHLGSRGRLLVCVDLRKDTAVMEAAYDDAIGVTAAFNRNMLRAVNRVLGSDFRPDRFEHRAVFDDEASRIEMRLVASRSQDVNLGNGAMRHFVQGEYIVTEHSYKYSPESFGALLATAGLSVDHVWTDERGWFGVFLARA